MADIGAYGAAIGACNRQRVLDWFLAHPGGSNTECGKALALNVNAVGRHVREIRKLWPIVSAPGGSRFNPERPAMRQLTDHIVNPVNDRITITIMDEPGSGGANHHYAVDCDGSENGLDIHFQNGPIAENGVNGITQEVLLAIVADRLRSFQQGPFSTKANACALTHVEEAMHWLHTRTLERMRRGVEGTLQA